MKVAVVLPCFNGADTIALQLAALTRQTWSPDAEILLVDNGSTDGSIRIFESFQRDLPSSRVVQAYDPDRGRRGVAASYALALESDADAFLFCEADDEVADDWFAVMSAALRDHDFIAAALEYHRLNPPELVDSDNDQQSAQVGLSVFPVGSGLRYASGCSLGLNRAVIDRVGMPDLAAGAAWDTDYCIRAALAGVELTFVPGTCIHYRLREGAKGSFRQARAWGRGHVALRARYDNLSRGRLGLMAVRRIATSVFRFRRVLFRKQSLQRWLWDAGWSFGIADGAVARNPHGVAR